MSSFSRVAGLLLAVAAIGLAGCGGKQGGAAAPAASDIQVTTTVVQPVAWSDTVRALGTAHARESVTLTAKVSEIVDQVHFESGQHVQAGQPLVTLRVDAQEAALGEAEATLAEAEEQYRRLEGLAGQKLVARSTLDAQRALREVAAARVRQMRSDISDRHVRAPFAGVLGIRQVSPGALVTPGTAIATLDDVSRVFVDFPVPETELAGVAPGQALSGTAGAYAGRTFDGTVATVSARLDAGSRSATVRGDFPNPDRVLRPGMLVEVTVARSTRQALVVPEIAVQQIGSETFVWRVKADDTVEKADVEVGGRVPGKAMITSGIAAGQRIVVEGTGKLQAGAKIVEGGAQAPATAK